MYTEDTEVKRLITNAKRKVYVVLYVDICHHKLTNAGHKNHETIHVGRLMIGAVCFKLFISVSHQKTFKKALSIT